MTLWGETSEGRGPFIFSGRPQRRSRNGPEDIISDGNSFQELCVRARAGSGRLLVIFSCNEVIIKLLRQLWGTLKEGTVCWGTPWMLFT